MLTKREIENWEKKHGLAVCIYCGQPAVYDDSDFSLTKRKTLIAWHRSCYVSSYYQGARRFSYGQ